MSRRAIFTAFFAAAVGYDRLFWFLLSGDWYLLFCGVTLCTGAVLRWKTPWALAGSGLIFLGGAVGASDALGFLFTNVNPVHNFVAALFYGGAAGLGFLGLLRWDASAADSRARPAWVASADVAQWTGAMMGFAGLGLITVCGLSAVGQYLAEQTQEFVSTTWILDSVAVWQLQIPEFLLMIAGGIALRKGRTWGHTVLLVLAGGYAVNGWFMVAYGGPFGDHWYDWTAALVCTPAFLVLLPRAGRTLPEAGEEKSRGAANIMDPAIAAASDCLSASANPVNVVEQPASDEVTLSPAWGVPPPAPAVETSEPTEQRTPSAWVRGLNRYFTLLRPSQGGRTARMVQAATVALLIAVFVTALYGGPSWNMSDAQQVEAAMERFFDGDMSALSDLEEIGQPALPRLRAIAMAIWLFDLGSDLGEERRLLHATIRRIEND